MRVFATGGSAYVQARHLLKRSWREILAWRNYLSPTTHTRSYAAVPGDGSFFILALHRNGFCLVLSRLPFLVSSVSPSPVYFRPRGFFSFYYVELRSARFVRRVVFSSLSESPGGCTSSATFLPVFAGGLFIFRSTTRT